MGGWGWGWVGGWNCTILKVKENPAVILFKKRGDLFTLLLLLLRKRPLDS